MGVASQSVSRDQVSLVSTVLLSPGCAPCGLEGALCHPSARGMRADLAQTSREVIRPAITIEGVAVTTTPVPVPSMHCPTPISMLSHIVSLFHILFPSGGSTQSTAVAFERPGSTKGLLWLGLFGGGWSKPRWTKRPNTIVGAQPLVSRLVDCARLRSDCHKCARTYSTPPDKREASDHLPGVSALLAGAISPPRVAGLYISSPHCVAFHLHSISTFTFCIFVFFQERPCSV